MHVGWEICCPRPTGDCSRRRRRRMREEYLYRIDSTNVHVTVTPPSKNEQKYSFVTVTPGRERFRPNSKIY
jgi:hypothetical protein